MKRLSEKHKLYLCRKSGFAIRKICAQNAEVERRRKKNSRTKGRRNGHGAHLIAPSHFMLMSKKPQQQGDQVKDFFDFLMKLRTVKPGPIVIDMSSVRHMVADAALLFKAELSRLVQSGGVSIEAIPPDSPRIQQVLKQTEIHSLLNLKIELSPDREDVVHWRVAEGHRQHVDPASLEPIMADIEDVTGLASHPVYQGIIESMGNCVEHAYKVHPDVTRPMPVSPGWWVFQQVKDGTLSVYVCDLGIGVNRALPLTLATEKGLLNKLFYLARRVKGEDCRSLIAAMEYGRTVSGLHHRGKGMRNAHAVVDDLGAGDFYAISNRGCYVYRKKPGSVEGSSRTFRLQHSINGTILGWVVPLNGTKISSESL